MTNGETFDDKYDLYFREVVLKNTGQIQRIYFFVYEGKTPKSGTLISDRVIPTGWTIKYGPKNGWPFLARK